MTLVLVQGHAEFATQVAAIGSGEAGHAPQKTMLCWLTDSSLLRRVCAQRTTPNAMMQNTKRPSHSGFPAWIAFRMEVSSCQTIAGMATGACWAAVPNVPPKPRGLTQSDRSQPRLRLRESHSKDGRARVGAGCWAMKPDRLTAGATSRPAHHACSSRHVLTALETVATSVPCTRFSITGRTASSCAAGPAGSSPMALASSTQPIRAAKLGALASARSTGSGLTRCGGRGARRDPPRLSHAVPPRRVQPAHAPSGDFSRGRGRR